MFPIFALCCCHCSTACCIRCQRLALINRIFNDTIVLSFCEVLVRVAVRLSVVTMRCIHMSRPVFPLANGRGWARGTRNPTEKGVTTNRHRCSSLFVYMPMNLMWSLRRIVYFVNALIAILKPQRND